MSDIFFPLRYTSTGNAIELLLLDSEGMATKTVTIPFLPFFLVRGGCSRVSHPLVTRAEPITLFDPLRMSEVQFCRAYVPAASHVPPAAEALRKAGLETWEHKIPHVINFIAERRVYPLMPYRLQGLRLEPAYEATAVVDYSEPPELEGEVPELSALFETPLPPMEEAAVALDIEVRDDKGFPDPATADREVTAVSLAYREGDNVVVRVLALEGRGDPAAAEVFDSEEELLETAGRVLAGRPVWITFNGDHFDLPYLHNRARHLSVRFPGIKLRKKGEDLEADPDGALHIDLYKFFKQRAIQSYAYASRYVSYSLDDVAGALLGVGKVPHVGPLYNLSPEKFTKYARRDVELTWRLAFGEPRAAELLFLLSRVSYTPPDMFVRSSISRWISNLFVVVHRRHGYAIPSPDAIARERGSEARSESELGKRFRGSVVLDPVPGLHRDVVVLDFASLYPSILDTENVSYETVNCPHEECRENRVPEVGHWVCKKRRGVFSHVIGFLRAVRVRVYKPRRKTDRWADIVQAAIKVFINASYGVLSTPGFQLYSLPAAESVTAFGRAKLLALREEITRLGGTPIYGDTDSVFVVGLSEEGVEAAIRFASEKLSAELEVDKEYTWLVLGEKKKNYLGLLKEGKLDVKGLILKKRNTPLFVRRFFEARIAPLLKTLDPANPASTIRALEDEIRALKAAVARRALPLSMYTMTVSLNKPPSEYTKTTPPHVAAARALQRAGVDVKPGDTIHFVYTRFGAMPVQMVALRDVDTRRYVEHVEALKRAMEPLLRIGRQGGGVLDGFLT